MKLFQKFQGDLTALSKRELDDKTKCDVVFSEALENVLSKKCANKFNEIHEASKDGKSCNCGSGSSNASAVVDLILLIDSSGSMGAAGQAISDVASKAIKNAKKECPTDLRLEWFGVDNKKPGVGIMPPGFGNFSQTHEQYLNGIGVNSALLTSNHPDSGVPPEQGADAIADLSNYFDWRENACRAIFYISDTALDGASGPTTAENDAATGFAIAEANKNNVTVFAHFVEPHESGFDVAATTKNYNDLCNQTGGQAIIGGTATKTKYEKLLQEVICKACGSVCKEIRFPEVKPCFNLTWGDSECDCMETNDLEVVCITACNCYSNVTFKDLKVGVVFITDENGNPVPPLPDGSPSVEVLPIGPICFGDLGPCKDEEASCKTREIVIRSCGARAGKYKVNLLAICYEVSKHFYESTSFEIELCKD